MAPAPARRDYDLELGRKLSADGLRVTVRDVRLYGAMVKVEVIDAEGGVIQVDLGRESFDRLQPTMSETLVVTPKRIRMFAPDPSP